MKSSAADPFAQHELDFSGRGLFIDFHMPDKLGKLDVRRKVDRQARARDEATDALEARPIANPLGDGYRGGLNHADRDRLAVEKFLVARHRFERVTDGVAEVQHRADV